MCKCKIECTHPDNNRVTDRDLEKAIKGIDYTRMGAKTTVCCVTLHNGFEIVGTSACVDPRNFDEELGRKFALEMALTKLAEMEGYRLQNEIFGRCEQCQNKQKED